MCYSTVVLTVFTDMIDCFAFVLLLVVHDLPDSRLLLLSPHHLLAFNHT